MTALPSNVNYGKVIGRFLLAVGDTSDLDTFPDGVPAEGTVTFTPSIPYVSAWTTPSPLTIAPQPITCTLDADGYLTDPAGNTGVYLIATDDDDLNPVGWTYQVLVRITGVIDRRFSISVPADSVVDLTLVQPEPPSSGTPSTGPSAAESALAAAGSASDAAVSAAAALASENAAAVSESNAAGSAAAALASKNAAATSESNAATSETNAAASAASAASTLANVIPKSLVDAKGDLLVGTANDAISRLAVGSNGSQLLADSNAASGVRWAGVPTLSTNLATTPIPIDNTDTNGAGARLNSAYYAVDSTSTFVAAGGDGPVVEPGRPAAAYRRKTITTASVSASRLIWKLTAMSPDTTPIGSSLGLPITAGRTYRVASWYRATIAGSPAIMLSYVFAWYDASGVRIGSSQPTAAAPAVYGAWTKLSAQITAPAGATTLALRQAWPPTGTTVTTGDTSDATAIQITDITDDPTDYGYFDGDSAGGRWTGTASGSASQLTALRAQDVPKLTDPATRKPIAGNTLTGTGSPEGVLTAPVGVKYIDTAGTNGAREWYKASGIGNTGWKVTQGDTGWLDLSGYLTNGWTGKLYARRVNERVEWRTGTGANQLSAAAATSGTFTTTLPSWLSSYRDSAISDPGVPIMTTAGAVRRLTIAQVMVITGMVTSDLFHSASAFSSVPDCPWPVGALPPAA